MEGSPVDASIFALLIAAGFLVLFKRRTNWSQIFHDNKWVLLFFLYCGISTAWSDYPFVSFKRWLKAIGDLIMVLVVLTENDPVEAVKALIRRWAYALIPLSVILIKYYPEISRSYDRWTGNVSYSGVAVNKNLLGCLCLICGLFFVWHLITIWRREDMSLKKTEVALSVLFLCLIWWLMTLADSSTSWAAYIFGIGILLLSGLPIMKRSQRGFDVYLFVCIVIISFIFIFIDGWKIMLGILNRDTSLTGRTEFWEKLLTMDNDPLIGAGFHSFWLGDRLRQLEGTFYWQPNQAHNGYLEIYLNLGAMGLVFFLGFIFTAYRNCRNAVVAGYDSGRFRMTLLGVSLIYGITEAGFRELHPMWFMCLFASLEWPKVGGTESTAESDASVEP